MGTIKKIWSFIISMKLMIVLMAVYAIVIAAATFIENDYGTETAFALVFKAKWFEALQAILGLGIIGNILKFKMYKVKKLPSFVFHVGFLVVIIGAAMTRYWGYEGVMHIREGDSVNRMLSSDALLQTKVVKGNLEYSNEKIIFLSSAGGNSFEQIVDVDGEEISVTYKDFIKSAVRAVVEDPAGEPAISLVITTPSGPETFFLQNKNVTEVGPFDFYLNKKPNESKRYVYIYTKNDKFFFSSNIDVEWFTMADQKKGSFEAGKEHEFNSKILYTIGGIKVVPKEIINKGAIRIISKKSADGTINLKTQDGLSALIVNVEYKGEVNEVALIGAGQRFKGYPANLKLDDLDLTLEWGSKELFLPFYLRLNEFVMDKYAGSMSPSSYRSLVNVVDKQNGVNMPYEIYMNNTLSYGGFKFFQSSYDKDEKGTILSVNHDPGKWPTYLGYTLLTLGFFFNLLNPSSRFGKLARTRYGNVNSFIFVAAVALMFSSAGDLNAQTNNHANNAPTQEEIVEFVKKIDLEHAKKFGSLIIQDRGGRMKPIDSVSIDAINKIHGSTSVLGLNHNQVLLGMSISGAYWQRIDMIKVKHPEVKELLGIPEDKKYFAFYKVFNDKGEYVLADAISDANIMKPGNRGKFEKELIKVDERINVAYMIYQGDMLRAFPLKDHDNNKWFIPSEIVKHFPPEQRDVFETVLTRYFQGVIGGMKGNNWDEADKALSQIKELQSKIGAAVMPPESRWKLEVAYNNWDIFNKLTPVYLISGLILLMFIFIRLIKPRINTKLITNIIIGVMILGFIAHTVNLGMRWYVSNHAPWSNGYEAMLYISWTTVLAGLSFARQSDFSVAITAIFAGLTLFTAHLSWLDPQMTNIVPVLQSYWLTIHVSVITASYGFLGLSTLLGFITLILFIMLSRKGSNEVSEQIVLNIKEATRINEMSMILGISLLTVGNFLGGVWANESWGRYWGWDPKETWTLVTIMVYAVVLHMRFIPKFNTPYTFALASVVSYSSVIMTYFGVNYYLAGMHSYAGGDPVPIPSWIYYVIATIVVIAVFAYGKTDTYKALKVKK